MYLFNLTIFLIDRWLKAGSLEIKPSAAAAAGTKVASFGITTHGTNTNDPDHPRGTLRN
jgi:hypothetical protein